MALTIIIAKNIAGTDLLIDDMGIFLASGASRTLTDNFTKLDVGESLDLYNYINTGKIVLNNGTRDLSLAESLAEINFRTELEDINSSSIMGADNLQFIFDADGGNNARTRITNGTYTLAARFIFKGAYNGIVPYFKIVAATKNSTGNCFLQLWDITHNAQIFEKTILGTSPAIYTVSNSTGVTTSESMFELRGKVLSSNELYIYSFLTQFA